MADRPASGQSAQPCYQHLQHGYFRPRAGTLEVYLRIGNKAHGFGDVGGAPL